MCRYYLSTSTVCWPRLGYHGNVRHGWPTDDGMIVYGTNCKPHTSGTVVVRLSVESCNYLFCTMHTVVVVLLSAKKCKAPKRECIHVNAPVSLATCRQPTSQVVQWYSGYWFFVLFFEAVFYAKKFCLTVKCCLWSRVIRLQMACDLCGRLIVHLMVCVFVFASSFAFHTLYLRRSRDTWKD